MLYALLNVFGVFSPTFGVAKILPGHRWTCSDDDKNQVFEISRNKIIPCLSSHGRRSSQVLVLFWVLLPLSPVDWYEKMIV